jgi:hypothetical protein
MALVFGSKEASKVLNQDKKIALNATRIAEIYVELDDLNDSILETKDHYEELSIQLRNLTLFRTKLIIELKHLGVNTQ